VKAPFQFAAEEEDRAVDDMKLSKYICKHWLLRLPMERFRKIQKCKVACGSVRLPCQTVEKGRRRRHKWNTQ